MSVRIAHVMAARPNYMKIAPVRTALAAYGVEQILIHAAGERAAAEIAAALELEPLARLSTS
jgi:UDP-N-acetylglucosamine 2-epimerase